MRTVILHGKLASAEALMAELSKLKIQVGNPGWESRVWIDDHEIVGIESVEFFVSGKTLPRARIVFSGECEIEGEFYPDMLQYIQALGTPRKEALCSDHWE